MIHSASRQALAVVQEEQKSVLSERRTLLGRLKTVDYPTVASELYAIAQLLVTQPRLRRMIGDPATAADARAQLAKRLFDGKVSDQALELLTVAVRQRWSSPWDLTDALESAGDDALFMAAEQDGTLDSVEDELFRFERILQAEGEATSLLDEAATEPSRRVEFLDSLVAGKVSPVTLALLQHAVASQRKRTIDLAIDDLLEKAAARKDESVARVLSAVPLTDAQEARLAAVLTRMYGRSITIRTAVEPSVRGGLVIRVGDELIDGSVATRLAQARTALAG